LSQKITIKQKHPALSSPKLLQMLTRIVSQYVTNALKCGQSFNGRTNERTNERTGGQLNYIMPKTLFSGIKRDVKDFIIYSKTKQMPILERKRSTELNLPENFEWQHICNLPQQTKLDTNLKYFQYILINRIIATNTFLTKIIIKDNSSCTFCNQFVCHIYSTNWILYRILAVSILYNIQFVE